MTITFSAPEQDEQLKPRITVFGVGGAGGNAVNNMISKQLEGVEFVVANTDAQALAQSLAERRVQLGRAITHGLGAGSRPDMGRAAAEEAMEDIGQHLGGSHMVFIAAGMGGGTGTGAAPVIARLAREQGMLTVGVVTKPFQFEGTNRMRIADSGIEEMQQFVDTLIVIPNQNLFRIANEKTTFADAFAMADDVLHSGVRGVTDLMVVPGLINLDFADIRSVMSEMGKAMMGTGESDGDDRARLAAEAAISNPLLDDVSMKGAHGVLINITGGPDMTLFEVDEAANRIGEEVDPDANIIFGSALDPSLEGKIRVSVVATGIDIEASERPRPVLRVYSDDSQPRPIPAEARGPHNPAAATPTVATGPVPQPAVISAGGAATAFAMPDIEEEEDPMPESGRVDLPEASPEATADAAPEAVADPSAEAQMKMAQDRAAETAPQSIGAGSEAAKPSTAPVARASEEKPFIPPAPAEAPESVEDHFEAADPFREAEMLNAAPAPAREKRRGPNLLQRMTGTGWGRREPAERTEPAPTGRPAAQPARPEPAGPAAARPEPAKSEPAQPARPAAEAAPTPPAPPKAPESAPAAPPAAESPAADNKAATPPAMPPMPKPAPTAKTAVKPASDSQPRLSGVDPQDRLPSSQSEEDLLDIPAFLRRQAN